MMYIFITLKEHYIDIFFLYSHFFLRQFLRQFTWKPATRWSSNPDFYCNSSNSWPAGTATWGAVFAALHWETWSYEKAVTLLIQWHMLKSCCCDFVMLFFFCPHTVSQDNRSTSSLTDEAELVISGRMSYNSLEMEPALLIRRQASAAWSCEAHTRRDWRRTVQWDGKTHHKIHNTLGTQLIAQCPIPVLGACGMSLKLPILLGQIN